MPTDSSDAVVTMQLIDDCYRSLEPESKTLETSQVEVLLGAWGDIWFKHT